MVEFADLKALKLWKGRSGDQKTRPIVWKDGIPCWTYHDIFSGAYDACTIPEGSHVIPNLWGILRDPGYWDDPDTFKPERFLHGKQQEFRQDERVLAFGTGSR